MGARSQKSWKRTRARAPRGARHPDRAAGGQDQLQDPAGCTMQVPEAFGQAGETKLMGLLGAVEFGGGPQSTPVGIAENEPVGATWPSVTTIALQLQRSDDSVKAR